MQQNESELDGETNSHVVLQKFKLYETRARYYLVGRDKSKQHWRILKIDRTEPSDLVIVEDPLLYTEKQCKGLLLKLDEGNKSTGGLQFVAKCYGIVGFINFLEPWYMILVTKRRPLGTICGHIIYGIDESQLITIPHSSVQSDTANSKTELRYRKLLSGVDLTKDFYFSYTYPIMHTLQRNATQDHISKLSGFPSSLLDPMGMDTYHSMFVWNSYLTRPIRHAIQNSRWTVALCHGYFGQAKLSLLGRVFIITLIARRSRHFAGTRYLKRGVNDNGHVANEVETEQIVYDENSGTGGIPPQMTSVVQVRGSIPLYWSQDVSRLNAKPDIQLHKFDPMYTSTRLHFENLEERYGNPVIILNLIKTFEKRPREMILRREFGRAATFLNTIRPKGEEIIFIHWDFHRFSKSKSAAGHVPIVLGDISDKCLDLTGLFYSGKPSTQAKRWARIRKAAGSQSSPSMTPQSNTNNRNSSEFPPYVPDSPSASSATHNWNPVFHERQESHSDLGTWIAANNTTSPSANHVYWPDFDKDPERVPQFQTGVLRTNCIDCLDRTNAAQYAFGLEALGRQLKLLELTDDGRLESDSGVAVALMDLYLAMGDALALQYGGSGAHSTGFPEKQGKWKATTRSREFLLSIRRYYSNAYTDAEKQDAINLFLGHFQPVEGRPDLWDLGAASHSVSGGSESPERFSQLDLDSASSEGSRRPLHNLPHWSAADLHSSANLISLSLPSAIEKGSKAKLVSFEKLEETGQGNLKSVRLHHDSDKPRRPPIANSAELQFGLDSPEWLFGQGLKKTTSKSPLKSADKPAPDQLSNQHLKNFNVAESFSICSLPNEVEFYEAYLNQTLSDHDDSYNSSLTPGAITESEPYLFYQQLCGGCSFVDHGMETEDVPVAEASYSLVSDPYRHSLVAETMGHALDMHNVIAQDFGGSLPYYMAPIMEENHESPLSVNEFADE